jgi:hypothetical protein
MLGGLTDPIMGANNIYITNGNGAAINANVQLLQTGDWIMIGHPINGEMFRVLKNKSPEIVLGSVIDPTISASLSINSLKYATYVVQVFSFGINDHAGYRLQFRSANTFVTLQGGDYGCLSTSSTASDIQIELMNLNTIDEIVVTRNQTVSTISFLITFTGDLLRGHVPEIVILDIGSNGCNSGSLTSPSVETIRRSVLPVYRLETTLPLAYDCEANELKDALQSLNKVARVDVTRSIEYNGFSWLITFNGFTPETTDLIPPLYINKMNVKAYIGGDAVASNFNTASTSFNLVNATATTVNFAGAATTAAVAVATMTTTIFFSL